MENMHDLQALIESGKRLIVLETQQEAGCVNSFKEIAKHSRHLYYRWSATQGLEQIPASFNQQPLSKNIEYLFSEILRSERASVFILIDFHPYIEDAMNIRRIKDVLAANEHNSLIFLSPNIEIPEELQPLITHYELPAPTAEQLKKMVYGHAKQWSREHNQKVQRKGNDVLQRLIANLSGLPLADADRLARNAIYNDGIIDNQDIVDVAKEKFKLLNQDSVLNLHLDFEKMQDIAGLHQLKHWLGVREAVFTGKVTLPGADIPKGVMLLGVQGCGKSLAAKAIAGAWKVPLLHLDLGALYNRFFGQTEENMRDALRTAELMSPCVLWVDEIEKGLSAVSASDDVSKRMLGTFLTWMAEKKQRVFVVATANDVSVLPPELLRKGRFDEVFFVDLPKQEDRSAILAIHLNKRELLTDLIDVEQIASLTCGFSGAELEQIVVAALYAGHSSGQPSITTELLVDQVKATRPLSLLMHEDVEALRRWAAQRSVMA